MKIWTGISIQYKHDQLPPLHLQKQMTTGQKYISVVYIGPILFIGPILIC